MLKYFWPASVPRPGTNQCGPEQPDTAFERRFRMSRALFSRICTVVVASSEYMRQGLRPDATGRLGITPLLKVICALRQISYGLPSDLSDDLFDVSETTGSLCVQEFCKAVDECVGNSYLRDPTDEDIERIESQLAAVGFQGCIGCRRMSGGAGWYWKNCPKALQGIMVGKDGKPNIRMEVVCSLDLWIWSFKFGLPGALNDLNILEVGQHFNRVLSGDFPSTHPTYTVAGQSFNWYYYLVDGIYPQWKIFIKTFTEPTANKEKQFSKLQEGVRKCVERVFGVLFRRYKILHSASELWRVSKMQVIARAAVILHNMTVETRHHSYNGDGSGGWSALFDIREDETGIVYQPVRSGDVFDALHGEQYVSDDIKVKGLHRQLTTALVDHIWEISGEM